MILKEQRVIIFNFFISNLKAGYTASYIANKEKMNQKSVYLYLEELKVTGVLRSKISGRNKEYFLNEENWELVLQFCYTIEHLKTFYYYKKKYKIKILMKKILPFVKGILIIFGSYAKETEKDISDLDLFIVGKYDEIKVQEIANLYDIKLDIKNYLKIPKNSAEDYLINEIKKNHIIVKGVENYYDLVNKV